MKPYKDYVIESDIIMKQIGNKRVIVLLASIYMKIIRRIHENGHFGIKKMAERIREEYYIPNLTAELEKFVKYYVLCVLAERKKGKVEGELAPIDKGDKPLSIYHIDHLRPMASTDKVYKYIFIIIDGFSKFV